MEHQETESQSTASQATEHGPLIAKPVVSDHSSEATHEEVSHEHTLFAEPIGHLGSLPITNSLLNSWLVVIVVLILGITIKNKIKSCF